MGTQSSTELFQHMATLLETGSSAGLTDAQLLDRFNGRRAAPASRTRRPRWRSPHSSRGTGPWSSASAGGPCPTLAMSRTLSRRDLPGPRSQVALDHITCRTRWDDGSTASRGRAAARARKGGAAKDGTRDPAARRPRGPAGRSLRSVGALDRPRRGTGAIAGEIPIAAGDVLPGRPEQRGRRRRLGCPLGTIQSRLSRGRDRLRTRLRRRGLAPSGTFPLACMGPLAVRHTASGALVEKTARNAMHLAAARSLGHGRASDIHTQSRRRSLEGHGPGLVEIGRGNRAPHRDHLHRGGGPARRGRARSRRGEGRGGNAQAVTDGTGRRAELRRPSAAPEAARTAAGRLGRRASRRPDHVIPGGLRVEGGQVLHGVPDIREAGRRLVRDRDGPDLLGPGDRAIRETTFEESTGLFQDGFWRPEGDRLVGEFIDHGADGHRRKTPFVIRFVDRDTMQMSGGASFVFRCTHPDASSPIDPKRGDPYSLRVHRVDTPRDPR